MLLVIANRHLYLILCKYNLLGLRLGKGYMQRQGQGEGRTQNRIELGGCKKSRRLSKVR